MLNICLILNVIESITGLSKIKINTADIDKLVKSYKNLNIEQAVAKMRIDGVADAEIKATLASQHYTQADIEQAMATNTANTSKTQDITLTKLQTTGHYALAAAAKVAKIALNAIAGIVISIVATKFISWLDGVINRQEKLSDASFEAKSNIDSLFDAINSKKSVVDEIAEKYAELAQGVDQLTGKNIKLSDDEYKEFLSLSNQLAETFPYLTSNYDENSNAIVNLTGDINSIVSSLDDLIKKEQELANQEMLDEMPAIYEELAYNVSKYNRELKSYQLFKNSMPDDIEISNFGKTSFKLDEEYYLGKDFEKEIKNKFDEKLKEYGIDDARVNINNGQYGTQFNISGLKNTEEYREKINKIYDEIKADIIKKTQEINSSIKSEMSGFTEYIYTWLSQDIDYTEIDSEGLKTAIQKLLFNSNWINDLPDNIDSTKWSKELEDWLKTNYLDAINNINDEEYKEKLANLFTMDLNPQQKIDLAQELQDYFNQNSIKVSLDFILNGDDPNSEQNLVNRLGTSLKDLTGDDTRAYNELIKYTDGFSNSQINAWLETTKYATNAGDAIFHIYK